AEDGVGDRGQRAVGPGQRERGGVGLAGGKPGARPTRRVGPGAGAVDRERAVGAGGGGLGDEGRRAVDVADGERAGGGNIGGQVRSEERRVGKGGGCGGVGAEDVDGDRGQRAVGAGHRERVGVGRAGGKVVVRRVRVVGPRAGAVHRERAVGAGGGGLGDEGRRAVDVADGERAGGGNIGGQVRSEERRVGKGGGCGGVGAEDVDGDRGQRAVGAGHRERVGVGRAGGKVVVRRVRVVGPRAGAVHRERAVGAGGGGLGDEGRRAVDVADGERAGGGNIGGQVGLGQVLRGGREDRGVVGAEDVDGGRGQRAVGAGDRERVAGARAAGTLVVRRARRVGPCSRARGSSGLVGAGGGGLGDEGRRAVDVADGERAGGGNIGGQVGLGQVLRGGREDRGVVGAEDVDGDRGQRAVGGGHLECGGVGSACGKLVVRRARRVGPGAGAVDRERAVGAGGGGLGDEGCTTLVRADGERAGGGNIGGQVGLGQVLRGGREDRGVVGAEDVDGDRGQRAVGAGDRERVAVGRAGGKLVVRRARRVGPGAGAVDRAGAVGAGGCGLRHDVRRFPTGGSADLAGGGNIGGQVGLGQVLRGGREDRGVVGAEDVDGDRGQRAVGAGDRERVAVGRAGGKLVV